MEDKVVRWIAGLAVATVVASAVLAGCGSSPHKAAVSSTATNASSTTLYSEGVLHSLTVETCRNNNKFARVYKQVEADSGPSGNGIVPASLVNQGKTDVKDLEYDVALLAGLDKNHPVIQAMVAAGKGLPGEMTDESEALGNMRGIAAGCSGVLPRFYSALLH